MYAAPLGDVKRLNVELASTQPFDKWYNKHVFLILNMALILHQLLIMYIGVDPGGRGQIPPKFKS